MSAYIACTSSWLGGTNAACLGTNTTCLGMNACIACTILGGVLVLPVWEILPAWDWVPALPALLSGWGILILPCLGTSTTCLGLSAYTPSWLGDTNAACLGTNTTCLGLSACIACTPSWLGELMLPAWVFTLSAWNWVPALLPGWGILMLPALVLTLPAWDWVPALPALLPGWGN